MSIWVSKGIDCWATDYQGESLISRGLDVAFSGLGYVRIGIHDENEWHGDVMLDENQLRTLIRVLRNRRRLLYGKSLWRRLHRKESN